MKNFDIVSKIRIYSIKECETRYKELIEAAQEATKRAYAPYSGYHVGAAVLLQNGEIVTGNNQENAAYPSGLCAERTTLFYANAQYSEIPVTAIAIAAFDNGEFTENICTPCGSCRQVLLEVENRFNIPVRILMCSRDEIYEAASVKDLLPLSFGKDSLG